MWAAVGSHRPGWCSGAHHLRGRHRGGCLRYRGSRLRSRNNYPSRWDNRSGLAFSGLGAG